MLRAFVLIAAIAAPLCAGAQAMGGITILDGEALVYRGSGRVQAAEGLTLAPGDIVETASSAFVQVEFADHTVAQLGPGTRVLFGAAAERARPERVLYLLQGWAKVREPGREADRAAGWDLRSPWAEIPAATPFVVVMQGTPAGLTLFVESGAPRLTERGAGAAPTPVALKENDLYRRRAGARGDTDRGAMAALIQDMPRPFRDSLPLRAERWREQAVAPRPAPDFGYADVEGWLKAEPAVRRPLMQRWKAKAREPAFRAALVSNLAAHPEWDPILFPEKYLPKRTSAAPGPAPAPAR